MAKLVIPNSLGMSFGAKFPQLKWKQPELTLLPEILFWPEVVSLGESPKVYYLWIAMQYPVRNFGYVYLAWKLCLSPLKWLRWAQLNSRVPSTQSCLVRELLTRWSKFCWRGLTAPPMRSWLHLPKQLGTVEKFLSSKYKLWFQATISVSQFTYQNGNE